MFRQPILISLAAIAFALTASVASARPLTPPRADLGQQASQLVEPVHYRKVRKFRGHHPHVVLRRHSRPSFSFSLSFGAPVVRSYRRYPVCYYDPYYGKVCSAPAYYPRSYYYRRW